MTNQLEPRKTFYIHFLSNNVNFNNSICLIMYSHHDTRNVPRNITNWYFVSFLHNEFSQNQGSVYMKMARQRNTREGVYLQTVNVDQWISQTTVSVWDSFNINGLLSPFIYKNTSKNRLHKIFTSIENYALQEFW